MIPACRRTPSAPLTAGKPAGGQKHRWLRCQGLKRVEGHGQFFRERVTNGTTTGDGVEQT
jgi:hypothetical protein